MVMYQSLSGSWKFSQTNKNAWRRAVVPGCVHTDLLEHKLIPDPFYRDNETPLQWISEGTWKYRRYFRADEALVANRRICLRCEGLDTMAVVYLNRKCLGRTDNMHRTWEFDIKPFIKTGRNCLEVVFYPVLPYIRKRQRERYMPGWAPPREIKGRGWIRKEQCNFGWDWGPILTTCGIWREIGVVAYDTARITDLAIRQKHGKNRVLLTVNAQLKRCTRRRMTMAVTVTQDRRVVATRTIAVPQQQARVRLSVNNPHRWWPHGMGDQPLYEVTADLLDDRGALADTASRRIGLRKLELVRKKDRWGQSFYFTCNGVPFFAKGANWIPADTFATRVTVADYRRLLGAARDANMNMVRVWGGGIYEDEVFYNFCDEMGICIWQDFMFACNAYPAFDDVFMNSVGHEAEDAVRRLRHHPSLALWCGNNELEQGLVGDTWTRTTMSWTDYKKLFDRLLPQTVKRLDPERPYWPSSPHTPVGDRQDWMNPNSGDAHLWKVWHGREPFEWYRTCTHRFNSEFGFQSFPEPSTVNRYTRPGDRNVTSPVMEHHQRSGTGNSLIMQYMLNWFLLPKNFDMTLWLSQIQHGMAMKYAVEHWRRSMPRGMGTLYWQINDCWPVASWASIDYYGNYKALHYMAKKFYAPVLVSGLDDWAKGTAEIWITSDLPKPVKGIITWSITDTRGHQLASGNEKAGIRPQASARALTLELAELIKWQGAHNLMLWMWLKVGKTVVSENFVSFARPKHLSLAPPGITFALRKRKDGAYTVTVGTKKPALWVWLQLDGTKATYSDNFFHLYPGRKRKITVVPGSPMTVKAFKKKLRIQSLVDTYQA